MINGLGERIRCFRRPRPAWHEKRLRALAQFAQRHRHEHRTHRTEADETDRRGAGESDCTRYFVNVSGGGFSGIVDEKLTPR